MTASSSDVLRPATPPIDLTKLRLTFPCAHELYRRLRKHLSNLTISEMDVVYPTLLEFAQRCISPDGLLNVIQSILDALQSARTTSLLPLRRAYTRALLATVIEDDRIYMAVAESIPKAAPQSVGNA